MYRLMGISSAATKSKVDEEFAIKAKDESIALILSDIDFHINRPITVKIWMKK